MNCGDFATHLGVRADNAHRVSVDRKGDAVKMAPPINPLRLSGGRPPLTEEVKFTGGRKTKNEKDRGAQTKKGVREAYQPSAPSDGADFPMKKEPKPPTLLTLGERRAVRAALKFRGALDLPQHSDGPIEQLLTPEVGSVAEKGREVAQVTNVTNGYRLGPRRVRDLRKTRIRKRESHIV